MKALKSGFLAQLSTIYWPISTPSPDNPWVLGQKNIIAWQTGGGTGIDSFDIQLHNSNRSVMTGFIPVVLRVPMEHLPGTKIFGGEIEVDLDTNAIPTGYVRALCAPAAPPQSACRVSRKSRSNGGPGRRKRPRDGEPLADFSVTASDSSSSTPTTARSTPT